jgi:hypothetical protein
MKIAGDPKFDPQIETYTVSDVHLPWQKKNLSRFVSLLEYE